MRKALIIGIDDYPQRPLQGCVNDAVEIATLLKKNGDGSPNFDVNLLTSNDDEITTDILIESVTSHFKGSADIAVFYFAGHGVINTETNAGYIVSSNGSKNAWGMSLNDLLAFANKAHPNIKSTVIILDCCHSGILGEVSGLSTSSVSIIGTGVTILTASHRDDKASENNKHGVFTDILIDGLSGGCADICGNITPASLYSHVDHCLGACEQRPVYKANVEQFISLRQVAPKVPFETLRNLPKYFQDPTSIFSLDPSFEPDRCNIPDEYKKIPVNEDNVRIFKELQCMNRCGLIIPVDAEHMYYAAINSKGCRLTAVGSHYRNLVIKGRI